MQSGASGDGAEREEGVADEVRGVEGGGGKGGWEVWRLSVEKLRALGSVLIQRAALVGHPVEGSGQVKLQCVAACVAACVAVCCSVLQCVLVYVAIR